MNSYKMRAECSADLARFLTNVPVDSVQAKRIEIRGVKLPDIEIEFESFHSLEFIRKELSLIEDGHVMLETVELASNYTGERK